MNNQQNQGVIEQPNTIKQEYENIGGLHKDWNSYIGNTTNPPTFEFK